ncbi:translation initiation factor IF-2 [Alicyclobacillus sp. ALC3]|uniref:translation initiation factor IF-2 n=1 Tax=Alicyclobacillus sp. ALC3 TaxID=2796143 RepID=UPI003FCC3D7E
MSSKEIITILNRLDVPVANHMSVMDDSMVNKVEQFFSDVKQRAAQRHASEVERELREKQRQRERQARLARQEEQRQQGQTRQTDTRTGSGSPRVEMRPGAAHVGGVESGQGNTSPHMDAGHTARTEVAQAPRADGGHTQRADAPQMPREDVAQVQRTEVGQTAHAAQQVEHSSANKEMQSARPATEGTPRPVEGSAQQSAGRPARPEGERGSYGSRNDNRGPRPVGSTERSSEGYGNRGGQGGNYGNRSGGAGQGGSYGNRSGGSSQGGGYGNRSAGGGQGGGQGGNYGNRSAGGGQGGGQGGNYGNRSAGGAGGSQGGNYGNRSAGGGQGGNYGNRSAGGAGGSQGGSYGNRSGGSGQGGSYGNRSGGAGQGGGYGNRSGGSGQGGGFGNRSGGGQGSGFGARSGGGQGSGFGARSGGGQGGGFGNRGGAGARPAAAGAAGAKPTSTAARNKDRGRAKPDYDRNRKEEFNENKLRGGRRRGGRGAVSNEVRKIELPKEVTVDGPMSVGDFAKLIRREPSEVIKKLLFLGIMATINQEIETDAMELIAGEYGVTLTVTQPVDEEAVDMLIEEEAPEVLQSRPPVVTIMGHVDHGKTTLLDAIRESKVVASEAGGITQHIGAYQVDVGDRQITFLDTPGHEAFTTMRARGAQVTDVTILVVAADDGVMPQTVEAINHAKAANVPIIVAVNKIDKENANPDRVKQELVGHGLVPEDWGGDTVFAHISALKREGLEELLEMVLLVADLRELKANPIGRPRGTVIEARLDKGRGPVATVLVQNGTLKVGDVVVAGTTYGRVRAMIDDLGKRVKEAGPSTPVEIQGFGDVPSAGDLFVVYDDERAARSLVQKRTNREKVEQLQVTSRVTLDDLYKQIQEGNMKELNVIVKADVQGSVEALVQSIEKIDVSGVRVKVIHRGAGAITESDVALASASNAVIIGFHVRPDVNAQRAAESEKVDIRLYRVIYNAIEELESAMKGLLDPEYKEAVLGHAEVREVFKISRIGTVAGCYVTDGKMVRDAEARLVRDGVVVYEGALESLKRFKDDAREVQTGFECGVTLERFTDVKVGDVVEVFKMEAVKVQ